ncbi:hypothetical protein LTR86_010811 [Recurvomyces mirabilis]|nr:hypothetical protein LTR86_010811 [Recurvomyces mirabilis]
MPRQHDAKIEAASSDHVETINTDDHYQRNSTGVDASDLAGYWTSPRLLGSLAATVLMANSLFFGVAMPVNIISIIDADIGPSDSAYLVPFIYQLFYGALHLFVARLSDIVGRRFFLSMGQILAVIGFAVCARANTIDTLIAGSAIAGVGGAASLLFPVIIHELIPNKHRPFGQAMILASVIPSVGFGPVIARAMVVHTAAGWRSIYWLQVGICAASALLYLACYFPPTFYAINSELSKWQEVKMLDYGGLFLYVAGLIVLLLGFTWAQGSYAWKSSHVITSLILGALLLVAFGLYELFVPLKQPLLPTKLFKIPNFTACLFIGSTMQMIWIVQSVFWPIQITTLFTTDQIQIGLLSCTTGAGLAAGELVFSPLYRYLGRVRWQLVLASAMTVAFSAALAAVTSQGRGMGIAFTTLAGLAVGWIELITIVTVGLVAPPNDIGVAQGLFSSVRQVFGIIAVSIYLAVYKSQLSTRLPRYVATAAEAAGLPPTSLTSLLTAVENGTVAALQAVPGISESITEAVALGSRQASTESLRTVYLATLAFTGVGLAAAFFIKEVDSLLTDYVNKTIRKPGMKQPV